MHTMQSSKKILLCLLLLLAANSYGGLISKQTYKPSNYSSPQRQHKTRDKSEDLKRLKSRSFVISCGGGCAMTYTANEIKQNTSYFKVKFKIEMYVNQVLTDTYIENYSFVVNGLKKIDKILDVKSENVVETLPLGARRSFLEFGKDLIQVYGIGAGFKK